MEQNIKTLGEEILATFLQKLGEVKLNDEELGLLSRAATRLASVALRLPGADEATRANLVMQRDAALATLENLQAAKTIQAKEILRQTVFEVIAKALKLGLGLLFAAI